MEIKNYIDLKENEIKEIRDNLLKAFDIYCEEPMKLTGYKDSRAYEKLQKAIKDTTGVTLGTSTLRDFITLKRKGAFRHDTFEAIDKFIATYTNTPTSIKNKPYITPAKQKVFWSINQGSPAGVFINSFKGQFIEWSVIKKEIETKVISQCPRIIPVGSTVEVGDFYEKKNWVIWIYDKKGNEIGSVWIGGNPLNKWFLDGMVRIGKTISDTEWEVYQVLQRYSDGSYRLVQSYV